MKTLFGKVVFIAFSLWLSGCAYYAWNSHKYRDFLSEGKADLAIAELEKKIEKPDNDILLYLMDLGTAYHAAGRYADAIKTFIKADKVAAQKDYTSVTEEVGSVVLNDDVKSYTGENFEKILIHVYLALDYTLLGDWESALVECRQVNHQLDKMISEGGLPYEKNAFAKYLAASLFEARGEINDAFVDYRQLKKWFPGLPELAVPLLRLADKMRATQEFEEFKKEYPGVNDYSLGKQKGEVILLVEVGKSPVKEPNPTFRLLPKFRKSYYMTDHVVLKEVALNKEVPSETLFDVESTAITDLDHRVGLILAKKAAGIVVKEVIADQVAKQTKSELAGALTSVLLHAVDNADLRHWSTLPAKFQLARMTLPAGKHDLSLDVVTNSGNRLSNLTLWQGYQVKPGKISFLHYRMTD